MIVKVGVGRMILAYEDYVYEVHMYNPKHDKKLQKNHGYIIGDYVYIYRGKNKNKNTEMGIYKDDKNEYYVQPGTKKEEEIFCVSNVIDMDIESISNKIKQQAEIYNNEEELEVINSSSEIFAPKIKDGDDFLKILVKKALEEKKISLKNYKNKFTKPHTLNNIKSALVKPTKTSIPNFEQWAELLGFDWEIRIFDNGQDKNNPLKYDIVFRSDEGLLENRDE